MQKNDLTERGMSEKDSNPQHMNFQSILQAEVPKGRDGKHKQIVARLIDNIARLPQGSALKVPFADLPDSKENIRSALSRATKQRDIAIATSSDDTYLYIWQTEVAS